MGSRFRGNDELDLTAGAHLPGDIPMLVGKMGSASVTSMEDWSFAAGAVKTASSRGIRHSLRDLGGRTLDGPVAHHRAVFCILVLGDLNRPGFAGGSNF